MLRSSCLHSPAGLFVVRREGWVAVVSLSERVACEDVVMFVNAAIASTAQREFHSRAGAQRMSLGFLHEYVLGNYRDLYAATLAMDINHSMQRWS
jgi:hypothetical protein